MNTDPLERIAAALERLAPAAHENADLDGPVAYRWDGASLQEVRHFLPLPLKLLVGMDRQKQALRDNLARHAAASAAHDMLLWGARGTGKSALVKAIVGDVGGPNGGLGLIEARADRLETLPQLFAELGDTARPFVLFLDDMAFDGDDGAARIIRSLLEGGVEARPDNVRLAVTSNQRNIVARQASEQGDPLNDRDIVEDRLALADRFGLKLGFQKPSQADYLAIVAAYAEHFDLDYDEADATAFAHGRGGQTGRVAWHYMVELAGRAGKKLRL